MALIKANRRAASCGHDWGRDNDAPPWPRPTWGWPEHRDDSAKESRQHGRPRFEPTEAHRCVEIGKQLLITRGSLTTFSIANDVAKYSPCPGAVHRHLPQVAPLNIMKLHSPQSAVLSAVTLQALVIVPFIPLPFVAQFRAAGSAAILRRNVWIYGVGASSPVHLHQAHRPSCSSRCTPTDGVHLMLYPHSPITRHGRALPGLLGFVYALAGTGLSQLLFRHQADGSITANGSTLIGQNWSQTKCPGHLLGAVCFRAGPTPLALRGLLKAGRRWGRQPTRSQQHPGKRAC